MCATMGEVDGSTMQFATFYLDDDLLGLDIRLVREVCRSPRITPVGLAPSVVSGLLNLRGQLVTVLDPRVPLGIEPRTAEGPCHAVVLKTTQELERAGLPDLGGVTASDRLALLADNVGDILTVPDSDVEPPPADTGRMAGRFLAGVAKLSDRLLLVLKVSALLAESGQPKQVSSHGDERTEDHGSR